MIVTFIGPPGSGKGTQASFVSAKLGIPHLSTGDILRRKIEAGGKESEELRSIMSSGKLIPSNLVNNLILEAIQSMNRGCILDGYPRNIEQAKFLEQNCEGKTSAIYFDIAHNLVIKRISGRFSCSECGTIYNKYFSPSEVEGICGKCQSTHFTYRTDDKEETVKVRLEEFNKETAPLVQYYEKLGRLKVIDANRAVDKIAEELQSMLKSD